MQASVEVGSAMDEFAFSLVLRHLVSIAPGLPILHVPPQLSAVWDMSESDAPAANRVCPMTQWFSQSRAQLLRARYLALHWSSEHFCSLIVDLQVWRAGPMGDKMPLPFEEQVASTASCAAIPTTFSPASSAPQMEAAAKNELLPSYSPLQQAALCESSTVEMGRGKRRRRSSQALRAAQQKNRSAIHTPVPMLHLDTLPAACSFTADKCALLRRLFLELDALCGTAWSVRLQRRDLISHLHLCGPLEQPDDWSCGYRLLCAWERLFTAMMIPSSTSMRPLALTPAMLNDVCGNLIPAGGAVVDAVLVERVRAWSEEASMVCAHI